MTGSEMQMKERRVLWGPLVPHVMPAALIVLSSALATLLRWCIDPLLLDLSPFSTYYFAVALAAIVGGFRVALVAALVCALTAHFFWVEPRLALTIASKGQLAQLGAFLLEAGLISGAVSLARFLHEDSHRPR